MRRVVKQNSLPVYCWSNKNNFGDLIGPVILSKLTNKKIKTIDRESSAPYLVTCGSIISHVNKNAVVWGSGLISGKDVKIKARKFFAVRGPLTRRALISRGVQCPNILGDPALLLPKVYPNNIKKKYNIGILPHYIDRECEWINLCRKKGHNVIDIINHNPILVLRKILECNYIISSSLHGLIVSDAYNIPNVWAKFSNNIIGNDFKFYDYLESVEKKRKPVIVKNQKLGEVLGYKDGRRIKWSSNGILEALDDAISLF